MSLAAPSGPTVARWLRRAVLAIGAVALLVLPQFSTNASFLGVADQPGPLVVLMIGLAMWLMPVLLLASWVAGSRATMPHPWLVVPAGLFVLGAAVSTAFASDKSSAIVRAAEMTGLWVGLFALVQAIRTDSERRFLLSVLVAAALVSAAVAIHQATVGLPNAWAYFQDHREETLARYGIEPGSHWEQAFIGRFFGGVQASMGHPNVLAAFLTLGFFVAVGLVREKWSEAGRRGARFLAAALGAAAVACAVGIVLTHSRAGQAALVVGLYWLAVAWWVRRRRVRIILYLLPLVVAAIGLAAATQVDHPMVAEALKTLRYRLDYWVATLRILRRHWDTGVGLENFGHHYVEHKVPWAPEEVGDPHNILLSTWSQLGLAGAAALVLLAVATVRVWLRGAVTSRDRLPAEALAKAGEGADGAAPRGEPLVPLLMPVMVVAGPVVIYSFAMGWHGGVAAVAVMAIIVGLGSAEDPSRLRASGRPFRSLRIGCVVALLAFAVQEQIGTAVLEPPTAWAMLVVIGVSLGPGRSRYTSGLRARRGSGGTSPGAPGAEPPGFPLRAPAKFLLILLAMIVSFLYVRQLILPVGREHARLRIAAWGLGAFGGDEPLRAAAEANPLAWEPDVLRGQAWQREAGSAESPAAAIHLERAIEGYRSAVMRHPRLRRAYLALADCCLATPGAYGDTTKLTAARVYLEEASRLYPTHILTRLRLADVIERLGEKQVALGAYREVLRLNDRMPEPGRRLAPALGAWVDARVKDLMGEGADALQAYREVIRLDDLVPQPRRRLSSSRRAEVEARIEELAEPPPPPRA